MMARTGFEETKVGDVSPESGWEHVEAAPTLSTFRRDVETLKTPGRFKIRYPVETVDESVDDAEETIEFEPLDSLEGVDLGDPALVAELNPNWGETIARNWGGLRRNIILLGRTVNQSKRSNEADFETVETEFRSLSRKMALLDTRIGVNPSMTGVVSVWEAIEDILAEGKRFETRFGALMDRQAEHDQLQRTMENAHAESRGEFDALYLSFENLADSYATSMPTIKAKLNTLDMENKARDPLRAQAQGASRGQDRSSSAQMEALALKLEQQMRKLQDDSRRLRQEVEEARDAREEPYEGTFGQYGTTRGNPITLGSNLRPREDLERDLEGIESRLDDIEGHRGGLVYSTHKAHFGSMHDVQKFIEEKTVASCGAYWDLFSILVRMGGRKQTGTQLAQATYAAHRLETSTLELDLLSSMSFDRPLAIFVADSVEADTLKCTSYESWIGVGLKSSVSGIIGADVTKLISGIRGTLKHQAGDTSLASTLLDNVEVQFNKLTAFIDKFFKELTTVANFPLDSAWKLIGRCLGGFFQSMVTMRSEVALLEEVKTQDHKAQMIWTVLQCHAMVEQFIAVDFKGHTVIVQQMTLYMMTERVDPAQMVKLATTVEMGQKVVAEAMKQVKQVVGDLEKMKVESATHKRRLDDVFNQLEAIKKKIVSVKS
jgi:hypothetical protein